MKEEIKNEEKKEVITNEEVTLRATKSLNAPLDDKYEALQVTVPNDVHDEPAFKLTPLLAIEYKMPEENRIQSEEKNEESLD